jgi:predicted transcriptional regulator
MDAQGGNRLLTAKIVGSYLRHNTVGASQVRELIAIVHRSLGELGQQAPVEEALTPAVSIRQSVRHDYVVCLDCGYRARMLRRHLNSRHGLSRAEYLKRWGLKPDHPLTAPAYSEHRSTLAKQLRLGRKPQADAGPPRPAKVAVVSDEEKADADHASPKRSTASGSDDAALQTKRTRQRRSRSRSAPPQSDPLATPTAEA